MHYDPNVRKEIKAEQKAIVKSHYWRIVGATLLYMVPLVLISLIAMSMSAGGAFRAAMSGNYSAVMQASETMNTAQTLQEVLALVVGAPLMLGLMNFFIGLMRGEEPGASEIIMPFTSLRTLWRAIRMNLVLFLRSLIWMIGPMVVFFVAFFTILVGNITMYGDITDEGIIGIFVLLLILIVVLLLIQVKIMMYQAGYVRLHDSEFIGTWDATREGNEAFRGHYFDLLKFFLSFAPWYLLYIGVSLVCVLPGMIAESIGLLLLGMIVLLVFMLLFLPFVAAYQNMSFLRLFERLAPAPEQPEKDFAAFQVNPQPGQQPAEQPFWSPAPAVPEAPAEEQPEAPAEEAEPEAAEPEAAAQPEETPEESGEDE